MLIADLAGAGDDVFVAGEFPKTAGSAGVKLVGADSDFSTEAELAAIVEASASVNHDGSGIDGGREPTRVLEISRHDPVGVMRTIVIDMRNRFINRLDNFDTQDRS